MAIVVGTIEVALGTGMTVGSGASSGVGRDEGGGAWVVVGVGLNLFEASANLTTCFIAFGLVRRKETFLALRRKLKKNISCFTVSAIHFTRKCCTVSSS